jgi:hypothetical protein
VTATASHFYVADRNHRVRRAATGFSFDFTAVEDFAGGEARRQIIDGPALSAALVGANGLARAADGSLYWAEYFNGTLRQLTAAGEVRTLIGTTDSPRGGTVDGPLASASLLLPGDVATGPDGALYVAQMYANNIRRVDLDAGVVSTFAAASGSSPGGWVDGPLALARFNRPSALAFGKTAAGADVLYVADRDNAVLRRIDLAAGVVSTFAGSATMSGTADGPPGTGRFSSLKSVTAGALGEVFVLDGARLREVASDGTVQTRDVVATSPEAIALDGDTVWISAGLELRRYSRTTGSTTLAFSARLGFRDGDSDTAGAQSFRALVPTADALIVMDSGRIRRLWK